MVQTKPSAAGDNWVKKSIGEFPGSPVSRIRDEWMLITIGWDNASVPEAGSKDALWNTMTASWGGMGELWSRDVAFIFIRPTRHSFEFANGSSVFSLSFFDESYRKALSYCGSHSGREVNKAAETGLTPIVFDDGSHSFAEAREVISCRKLYTHDIDPACFIDPSLKEHYPLKDYHRLFIGEITAYRVRT